MLLKVVVFLIVIVVTSAQDGFCVGNSPCQNGGTCAKVIGVNVCQCPQGFSGSICQISLTTQAPVPSGTTVRFCDFNPCYNGGTCVIINKHAECWCTNGYTGTTCNYHKSTTHATSPTTTPAPTTTPDPVTTQAPTTTKTPVNVCPDFDVTYWACGEAEVIFMLEYGRTDTGSSIDHEGDFFKLLLNKYKVDFQHVRVGVVVYHDTVEEVVHLKDYENDIPGLKARITQLNSQLKPSGTPDLAKALDFVRENSFTEARPGVPKVIVSIVHQMARGQSTIIQAGEKVKNDCIMHFVQAVGGSSLNEATLKQIATEPNSPYYVEHRSFSGLEFLGYTYNLICPSN